MGKRPTILVIDDEEADIQLMKMAMDQVDYSTNVVGVTDSRQALECIRGICPEKRPECLPDLVVIDLYMPGCSGSVLVQEIQQQPSLKDVPIVILTGSEDQRDLLKLRESGICGYFVKPQILTEYLSIARELQALLQQKADGVTPPPVPHKIVTNSPFLQRN